MGSKLVEYHGGEPWFDNPQLILANGKRKGKRMARRASRNRRRGGRPRSNFYSAGALAGNPHKRRHRGRGRKSGFAMNRRHRRRHYRSNPQLLGMTLPPFDVVAWSAAGLIAPGMVAGWIMPMIPADWKTNADGTPNQITNFAVKAGSVLIPSLLVRQLVSQRGGNIMLVAGAASLVLQAIKTFAPSFATQIGLGYQPMLGEYVRRPANVVGMTPRAGLSEYMGQAPGYSRQGTPSRLDPAARF